MFVIWTSPDSLKIHALEEYLKSFGLKVLVRGENRAGVSGIIPPIECWSEIVVLDEEQLAEAVGKVEEFFKAGRAVEIGWTCTTCGETLEPQFTDCWRCAQQAALPAPPPDRTVESLGAISRVLLGMQAVFFLWLCSALMEDGYVISTIRGWNRPEVYVPYFLLSWAAWSGVLLQWNFARYLYLVVLGVTICGAGFGGLFGESYLFLTLSLLVTGIVVVVTVFFSALRMKYV